MRRIYRKQLCPVFLNKYPDIRLINLDLLTYAGDMANLSDAPQDERHIFVQGDICDRSLIESLFEKYDIRGVIHFAAESHVDNSIKIRCVRPNQRQRYLYPLIMLSL